MIAMIMVTAMIMNGNCNDGGDYNDDNINIDISAIGDGNIAVELVKIYIYHIHI